MKLRDYVCEVCQKVRIDELVRNGDTVPLCCGTPMVPVVSAPGLVQVKGFNAANNDGLKGSK